jgi:HPt (histidine-containing phosphotransfer) domain-containing protein
MMNRENQMHKITVYVDSDLLGLIPEFLENRQKDTATLKKALEQNDYPAIQAIGHNLKGSGGSYGLDTITEIGKLLEQAVENNNAAEIGKLIDRLSSFLENVEVLETKRNMVCAFCGRPFQPRADEKYCPQCIVDKQEKVIEKSEEKATGKKKRDKRVLWISFMLLLIAACMAVLIVQIPKILDGTRPGKPIRQGTYETDRTTDECIKNLWIISKALQENKAPDSSIRCPATDEPYRIETTKAYCPNPDKHNLKSLSVGKETKIPEAVK